MRHGALEHTLSSSVSNRWVVVGISMLALEACESILWGVFTGGFQVCAWIRVEHALDRACDYSTCLAAMVSA